MANSGSLTETSILATSRKDFSKGKESYLFKIKASIQEHFPKAASMDLANLSTSTDHITKATGKIAECMAKVSSFSLTALQFMKASFRKD
jgi:hypothetical protein